MYIRCGTSYQKRAIDINRDILQTCRVHYRVDVISRIRREYNVCTTLVTLLEGIKDVLGIIGTIPIGRNGTSTNLPIYARQGAGKAADAQGKAKDERSRREEFHPG